MAMTISAAKKQSNLRAGVIDNSFIDALTYADISANNTKLAEVEIEKDNFLYSLYGDGIKLHDMFRMAGKVTNINGTKFQTFKATAPYQNYKVGTATTAVTTAGADLTIVFKDSVFANGSPFIVGMTMYIPPKFVTISIGGVDATPTVAIPVRIKTVTPASKTVVATPFNRTAKFLAIAAETEIGVYGIGGARGGAPTGGVVNTNAQDTWYTSYRSWAVEMEEGSTMQEDIFINIPKGLLEGAGIHDAKQVRALNPYMNSAAGRQILQNYLYFNRDLEANFMYGDENTNSLTDTMENASTKKVQASKGLLTYASERAIPATRNADITVADFTALEAALRAAGFMARNLKGYVAPDLNNELANAFQTWVTTNADGKDLYSFGDIKVTPKSITWGAMNIDFFRMESFGDPNGMGGVGFGLSNRGLIIPEEESNVTVGEEMVSLPNVSLLLNKGPRGDRSYLAELLHGFTERDGQPVKKWGSDTLMLKAEQGVCAVSIERTIDLTRPVA